MTGRLCWCFWMRTRTLAAFGLVWAAVGSWEASAVAQPTGADLTKAREVYREGVQLEAANDWAGALTKFETVAAVKMSPAVRFHIARCQHKLGNLLEALGGYRLAAHDAASDPRAAETLHEAEKALADVEHRIPRLILVRGKGAEAAQIHLDGVALGEAAIGKEIPVNPGGHTVDVIRPGAKPQRQIVGLGESELKTIEVSLASVETSPIQNDTAKDQAPALVAPVQSAQNPPVLPWIFIGSGVASLAGSGAFFALRANAINELDRACTNNLCPLSMKDTGDRGKTYATLGSVTLGLGLVSLGVGTAMLIRERRPEQVAVPGASMGKAPSSQVRLMFDAGPNAAEARLVGTF